MRSPSNTRFRAGYLRNTEGVYLRSLLNDRNLCVIASKTAITDTELGIQHVNASFQRLRVEQVLRLHVVRSMLRTIGRKKPTLRTVYGC